MSKGQINYLLALTTLVVVWLYFNTFYLVAKRPPMPVGGMIPTSAARFQNPTGAQNIQQPPNILEILKNQQRALQASVASKGIPPAPSEVPQKDKAR